jgi:hypothetical protein
MCFEKMAAFVTQQIIFSFAVDGLFEPAQFWQVLQQSRGQNDAVRKKLMALPSLSCVLCKFRAAKTCYMVQGK